MGRFTSAATLFACVALASAQAPVPDRLSQLGWKLGNQSKPEGEGVVIDIWGDFQCPDTRTAWLEVVSPLLKHISDNHLPVTLTYRAFPLPYHNNAYLSARAAIAAVDLLVQNHKLSNAAAFTAVADQILSKKQDLFQNAATASLTYDETLEQVLWPIVQAAGLTDTEKPGFLALSKASTTDGNLRVSWKYACQRGVTGTPVYAADYVISDAAASYSLQQWKDFISARV
eukprot:TRINITY_DN4653_c0_g1_i1.p2 TRINITY_DN4653_c0_g1~~TRINITY_DN4653_c0_g1_i1.p2  ORF type:complete len:246 (+),score=103.51 TRINITY_DN4653_c0_g1_i1:54-740(+)